MSFQSFVDHFLAHPTLHVDSASPLPIPQSLDLLAEGPEGEWQLVLEDDLAVVLYLKPGVAWVGERVLAHLREMWPGLAWHEIHDGTPGPRPITWEKPEGTGLASLVKLVQAAVALGPLPPAPSALDSFLEFQRSLKLPR